MRRDQSTKGTQIDGAGPVLPDSLAGTGARMGGIHPGVKVALAILAALFWLAAGRIVPNDHMLRIELIPKYSSFRLGGKFPFEIHITNFSDHTVLINNHLVYMNWPDFMVKSFPSVMQTINFYIIEPDGNPHTSACLIDAWMAREYEFDILYPNESIVEHWDLGDGCTKFFDSTGIYKVKVCYYNNISPGYLAEYWQEVSPLDLRQAWKGEICSNEVQVEVVP